MNMNLIEHKEQVEAQALDYIANTEHRIIKIAEETGLSVAWISKFKAGTLPSAPKAEQLHALVSWFDDNPG